MLEEWSAYYTNNPNDDYNLVIEILYRDSDVAFISRGQNGLELKWYANESDLVVPLEWIYSLLADAKSRLGNKEENVPNE